MRLKTNAFIIVMYAMALLALVFYVAAWFSGDVVRSIWCVVHGCFLLLLSIWLNVCS